MQASAVDAELLTKFEREVKGRVPHLGADGRVVNPTPFTDVTEPLLAFAREEYGMKMVAAGVKVFGKFDSEIFGGSIKVRPAVQILEAAIRSGKLSRNQTVFEATSGNFGLALGLVGKLGLDVVALVSRKLQDGVLKQLQSDGVKLVNLDIDICPAPGIQADPNLLMAKGAALSVRRQLGELGFDVAPFDRVLTRAEELLARQDAINLAKLLAEAYGGFCTEQYDNDLNVVAHETITGPELDAQLGQSGLSFADFDVVCTFGTGGTASGLSNYVKGKYDRKSVRVVFPLAEQEVAGIRSKEKAMGLRFYRPAEYAGEHEVDFEKAQRLLRYFNGKGFDVGESGALALLGCLQLINYGAGKNFVVFVADGAAKYAKPADDAPKPRREEATLQEAASSIHEYGGVVWAHNMFVPSEAGIKAIAASLGCDEGRIRVAKAKDVQRTIATRELSGDMGELVQGGNGRVLVVCMAGGTSLYLAKVLREKGIEAESLVGGITGLPSARGKQPFDLVQIAKE